MPFSIGASLSGWNIGSSQGVESGPTVYDLSALDSMAFSTGISNSVFLGLKSSDSMVLAGTVLSIINISDSILDTFLFIDSSSGSSQATISLSCSDGIIFSDSVVGRLMLDLSSIDGITLSDSAAGVIELNVTCPSGIALSDFANATATILGSVGDGLVFSDISQETSFLPVGEVTITATSARPTVTASGKPLEIIFNIIKKPTITGGN